MKSIIFVIAASLSSCAWAASRTSPPDGSIVVRTDAGSGEYSTISAAVDAIGESGDASIFIYPGTYEEQVYIDRSGALTIYGYTEDTTTYSSNEVLLTHSLSAASAGSNDASGTLRIHSDNVAVYNIDVENSYGSGSQAIAISEYGSQVGLYACSFIGFQDTLLANAGTQVYLKGYIEGATDFIFGRTGLAYFAENTIAVSAKGWITASGRESDDSGSYVFESNTIVLADGANSNADNAVYFGRPWGAYAKVIFKNTVVDAPLNPALWSIWNSGDERTSNVFFADYNTQGISASRPSFATELSSSEADQYSIASAVGSDYASWVDAEYL